MAYIEQLSLVDFRNYESAELEFSTGVNILIGPNGQGKTNVVEAVEYLATLGSHRVATDLPLVRQGANSAFVSGRVVAGLNDHRVLNVSLEIKTSGANLAKLNSTPKRPRDLLGVLRCVVFTPLDLDLVRGDPTDRRAFIDSVVITRWPRYAGVKADYERVLKQRNALLKSLVGVRLDESASISLEIWNEQLAGFGAELTAARIKTLTDLAPYIQDAYQSIAPQESTATAKYLLKAAEYVARETPTEAKAITSPPNTSMTTEAVAGETPTEVEELRLLLLEALQARKSEELRRGISLIGPHRDEIALSIGTLPAKGYASHGESWSLALSLKLATFALLRAEYNEPVLILDDVFAELDATRRTRLAEAVKTADQVLITAAVEADLPPDLTGKRFQVSAGTITS
jgi:DNA replication and repair protein RecF